MDKNNNDLFELMTKMYSDMTTKMDVMNSEMSGMKSEISGIKSEISGMKSEISSIKQEQQITNHGLEQLENKVDLGFEKLTTRMDNLSSGIGCVVGNDVSETISYKINSITEDLSFIKYKLNITEEDVYKIKNHLRIIK